MADSITFEFAVYRLPGDPTDPFTVLRQTVAEKYPNLKLVSEIPKHPTVPVIVARVEKHVRSEYAPPSLESLKYFGEGLSKEQAQALQEAKEALILDFAHPKGRSWTALKTANELVEQVARKSGGLVWDEETRQVFTPDSWHQKRLASWADGPPRISTQTVIHEYNSGEYERAITLGMTKLGLPDVVVEDISWSSNDQVGTFINIFCQAMLEGATFATPDAFKLDLRSIKNSKVRDAKVKGNGTGIACISLKQGRWEEGDPKNRLVELAPYKYSGPDLHAKQDQMFGSFFGWEDSIKYVKHNAELLAASQEAKAKLPGLQKAFTAGLQPGEFLQVKAPFHTPDGGTEWMWVEITNWNGNKIRGLLKNDPFNVPGLHGGQIVDVQQDDVFDYIRTYPDGRTEGNTTGEILKKMDEGKKPDASPSRPTAPPDCG
jgi:uncharacterized protein YegJ (DUF2314 family)